MALEYQLTSQEVHVIAYIYHWGRNEILSLSIKERKMYVDFIRQQKETENNTQ